MSGQKSPEPAWSVPVKVAEIPETGRRVDIVADGGTREAIAKAAGLAALPRLEAGFDLSRQGVEGLRLAGRLDMIVLHLVLLLRQLSKAEIAAPTGQQLFDRFCQDIDDNFREMGVGDLTVPKEMRKVAEAFYGRAKAYEAALADDAPAALEAAVTRNVFGVIEPSLGARRLAAYMREASWQLDGQSPDALANGKLEFPDPEAVASS